MTLRRLFSSFSPGSKEEEIIESPGTRYFVGVLAPGKRAKAGTAPAEPETAKPAAEQRALFDTANGDV